jgi:hypothetical protein
MTALLWLSVWLAAMAVVGAIVLVVLDRGDWL